MKSYCISSAILALAIAGATATYLPALADNNIIKTDNNTVKQERTGNQTDIDPALAGDIRTRLASAVDKAVTQNSYKDMVGSLDETTRDRLNTEKDINLDDLNGKIDQFRKDFKDKYNEDFSMNAKELDGVAVNRGSDDDHATIMLSSFRTLNAKNDIPADSVRPAPANNAAARTLTGQINLVRERKQLGNSWRIMATDSNLSGQQLRDAVGAKLASIDSNKTAWPANVHEAYNCIAGQILQTLTQPATTNNTVENR